MFIVPFFILTIENIALTGTAEQSTVYVNSYNPGPEKAIDGDTRPTFTSGTCMHTAVDDTEVWWKVTLLDISIIKEVHIYNRGDGSGGGDSKLNFN